MVFDALTWFRTLLIGLLVFCLIRWWKKPHPRFPPGPRGIPFLGVIPFMTGLPHKKIYEWSKVYGPILSIRLTSSDVVCIMDYKTIKEAFVRNGTSMSDRPIMNTLNQISKGHGIIDQKYNEAFKMHRRNGSKIFKGLGSNRVNMNDVVSNEARHLLQYLLPRCGKPLDVRYALYNATANAIAKIAFGKRFDHDDITFQSIVGGAMTLTQDLKFTKKLLFMLGIPSLRHFPPFKAANQRFIELNEGIFEFVQKQIDEHYKTLDPQNVRDFIDIYLTENLNSTQSNRMDSNSNAELRGFIKDLFAAGIDTASNAISWAIVTLLHYPEIHNKLQEELDLVIGPDEHISMTCKDSLPYTSAFIQEVMRYHTLVPMAVPHMTSADVEINGYHIPKNTMVQGGIWAVHNDPKNWPEPQKFDPMRHIDSSGKFVPSQKVMPFSIGVRRCIGENLAKMEVFVFLATLIRHFSISCVPGDDLPPLNSGPLGFVYCPFPFKVVISKR